MEKLAKLIHKSNITYLPTNLPVQYFGLPDRKVYVIFARFYEIKFKRSDLEYVIAEHLEFSFDYEGNKIIPHSPENKNTPVYNEMVDKPDPKINILKVYRELNSFAEAEKVLNKKARDLMNKKEDTISISTNKEKAKKISIA